MTQDQGRCPQAGEAGGEPPAPYRGWAANIWGHLQVGTSLLHGSRGEARTGGVYLPPALQSPLMALSLWPLLLRYHGTHGDDKAILTEPWGHIRPASLCGYVMRSAGPGAWEDESFHYIQIFSGNCNHF